MTLHSWLLANSALTSPFAQRTITPGPQGARDGLRDRARLKGSAAQYEQPVRDDVAGATVITHEDGTWELELEVPIVSFERP